MPLLTLSMIVKNEEKYLRECLESVKEVVDEIVIVDTGSTDRTIAIAEEFNAKVHHFNWINDFAAARNFALEKSTGEYILYMDADERLSEKSIPELKKIIKSGLKGAFNCTVNNIDTINNRPHLMKYTRLFKNNKKLRFIGAVHEQIIESVKELNYKILNCTVEIIHVGYNIEREGILQKAKRNLELLLKEYEKEPSAYVIFQLAQTYSALGDEENTVKYFKLTTEHLKSLPFYKSQAFRHLAAYEFNHNNFDEALRLAQEGMKHGKDYPILNMLMCKILQKFERNTEAVKYIIKAYEVNHDLHEGKRAVEYAILVDEKHIILTGLHAAILASDKISFNYFFDLLVKIDSKTAEGNSLIRLMRILLNNEKFNLSEASALSSVINTVTLELIVALLKGYSHQAQKLALLEAAGDEVNNLSSYQNYYALVLAENNRIPEAVRAFQKSLELKSPDPSSVFYLVSIYVQNGEFEKIQPLVDFAVNEFGMIPEVNQRLNMLKEKIALLLN